MKRKPRVITKCVANTYAADGERIVEFSFPDAQQGGLISFQQRDDGQCLVSIYRVSDGVRVVPPDSQVATAYQPLTGATCSCSPGIQRDNCPACESTGMVVDFAAIRARRKGGAS